MHCPHYDLPRPPGERPAAQGPTEPLADSPVALGRKPGAQGLAIQDTAQRLAAPELDLGLAGPEPCCVDALSRRREAPRHCAPTEAHDAHVVDVRVLGTAALGQGPPRPQQGWALDRSCGGPSPVRASSSSQPRRPLGKNTSTRRSPIGSAAHAGTRRLSGLSSRPSKVTPAGPTSAASTLLRRK